MEFLRDYKIGVTAKELEEHVRMRITNDLTFFDGTMPREVAISWSGYLQAVGEWAPAATGPMIGRLRDMLPDIEDDPTEASSSGRLPW